MFVNREMGRESRTLPPTDRRLSTAPGGDPATIGAAAPFAARPAGDARR